MYYIERFFYIRVYASVKYPDHKYVYLLSVTKYLNNNVNIALFNFLLGSFNVCATFKLSSLLREGNICVA